MMFSLRSEGTHVHKIYLTALIVMSAADYITYFCMHFIGILFTDSKCYNFRCIIRFMLILSVYIVYIILH